MTGNTKIEWATKVWNPTVGCTPVSDGCAHCYAKRMYERFYQSKPFSQVQLHPERLEDPLKWRKPQRVFVDSMSDLFHDEVSGDFIEDVIETISNCPRHTFMILTKRPKRMNFLFQEVMKFLAENPLPNLWLGVSVEDQKSADERIPVLLKTPVAVRFVSVEPMLGPVDLVPYLKLPPFHVNYKLSGMNKWSGLNWVICGGESGPGARPMHPDWVRSLRDQCVNAGVPFFFKHWGEWRENDYPETQKWKAETYYCQNAVSKINEEDFFRIGKNRAGRLLDGREWNQFPSSEKDKR